MALSMESGRSAQQLQLSGVAVVARVSMGVVVVGMVDGKDGETLAVVVSLGG